MDHARHIGNHWWMLARLLLVGVPIVAAAIWYGRSVGRDLLDAERWIADLGFWGPLVLILATGLLSVLMFPDTPFSMAAGALFGLLWGAVFAIAGAVLGAALAFWVSRLLLRERVSKYLSERPRWSAIERAASREGTRLQVLIRLTPLHSASFSYAMGASQLSFAAFMLGCVGMIPGIALEVYFGYLASHVARLSAGVSKHSMLHTAAIVFGLVVAMAAIAYVTRLARRAIAGSETTSTPPALAGAASPSETSVNQS